MTKEKKKLTQTSRFRSMWNVTQIPVSFFCVKSSSEASNVSNGIWRPTRTKDSRETNKDGCFGIRVLEKLGGSDIWPVFIRLKVTMNSNTTGMNSAFRYSTRKKKWVQEIVFVWFPYYLSWSMMIVIERTRYFVSTTRKQSFFILLLFFTKVHDFFTHHKIFQKSRSSIASSQRVCIVYLYAKLRCFLSSRVINISINVCHRGSSTIARTRNKLATKQNE